MAPRHGREKGLDRSRRGRRRGSTGRPNILAAHSIRQRIKDLPMLRERLDPPLPRPRDSRLARGLGRLVKDLLNRRQALRHPRLDLGELATSPDQSGNVMCQTHLVVSKVVPGEPGGHDQND
jgi:hypothetical protein